MATPAAMQEFARDVVKAAKTDEAKSFGHVLLGNTYFLSAPHRRPGQKAQDTAALKNRFEVGFHCSVSQDIHLLCCVGSGLQLAAAGA